MNCNIDTTPDFALELKQLAKRYPSIRDDYETFLKELRENPLMGTKLGKKLRKVRFAIASKGKGKSGGARVITYNVQQTESDVNITLMSIYDKSEIGNVSDTYLRQLVKEIESRKQ